MYKSLPFSIELGLSPISLKFFGMSYLD